MAFNLQTIDQLTSLILKKFKDLICDVKEWPSKLGDWDCSLRVVLLPLSTSGSENGKNNSENVVQM